MSKNILLVLNELIKYIVKCANIKFNAKYESLLKKFCEDKNVDYITLSFHSEVVSQ